MRDVKPGITGLAQVTLTYSGKPQQGSDVEQHADELTDPCRLDEIAAGAEADDMRIKLLYDLPYVAALEKFSSYISLEFYCIAQTPLVMLRGLSKRRGQAR